MVKRIFMQMTTCNNVFICIQRGLDQLEAGWNTLKVVNPVNCQFCLEWKFGERITRRSCHSESAISGWRGQTASERHSFSYCTRESSDVFPTVDNNHFFVEYFLLSGSCPLQFQKSCSSSVCKIIESYLYLWHHSYKICKAAVSELKFGVFYSELNGEICCLQVRRNFRTIFTVSYFKWWL